MADSVVQIAPDSTGKYIDNSSLTVGANTVYRQRLNISDPTVAAGLATVTVSPGTADYGLTVRNVNSDLVITGNISTTDVAVAAPAGAGAFVSGSSTAGSYVVTPLLGQGDSGFNIQITGLTSGSLYVEASLDSTTGADGNWMQITARQMGVLNTNIVSTITANGMWRGSSGGYKYLRIRSSGTLSGSPAVVIRVGDGVAPVFLESSMPAGTNTLGAVRITDGTTFGAMRPDSVFRVAMDATSLLLDTFETLDTANTWTLGGTVVPTQTAGNLSVNAGTTASASSTIRSQPAFTNGATAFTYYTSAWVIDAAAVTGNKRVWGLGLPNATPTTAVPITNGVVYEVQDTDGSLVGAVYSNSARTQTVTIPRPTDGGAHRYAIFFRASRVYYELDSNPATTYSLPLPNPVVDALPAVAVSVNAASGNPATAATLACSVVGVADTGRNNQQISDGTFAWRKATVKAGSTASVATDPALVVTMSPNSITTVQGFQPTPTTGNITTATTVVGPVGTGSMNLITVAHYGTYAGVSCVYEASIDNINYFAVQGSRVDNAVTVTGLTSASNTSQASDIPIGGWNYFRVRATGWGSGTCITSISPQSGAFDPCPASIAQGPYQSGATVSGVAPVLFGGGSLAGGTGTIQTATIKPASTAALSSDSSLVVSINPNTPATVVGASGTSVNGALTTAVASTTGTTNTTATVVAAVGTAGNATITIKGTFSGTYFFEASDDNGVTWYLILVSPMGGGVASSSTGPITTATAYNVSCPGITHLRVRCGTFVSGSATVNIFPGGFLYAPVANVIVQNPTRTNFNIYSESIAGVTTEALTAFSYTSGYGTPTTGATSVTVPTGKTLRIVSITVSFVSTSTTANTTRVRLRVNTAGAATVSSNIIWTMRFGWSSATFIANQVQTTSIPFPDGFEIPAGAGIGFSHIEAAANGTIDLSVDGFLY